MTECPRQKNVQSGKWKGPLWLYPPSTFKLHRETIWSSKAFYAYCFTILERKQTPAPWLGLIHSVIHFIQRHSNPQILIQKLTTVRYSSRVQQYPVDFVSELVIILHGHQPLLKHCDYFLPFSQPILQMFFLNLKKISSNAPADCKQTRSTKLTKPSCCQTGPRFLHRQNRQSRKCFDSLTSAMKDDV